MTTPVITDAMTEAALDAWYHGPLWRDVTDPTPLQRDMRAALTAALAVSGYGEVVEALRNVRKLIAEAASTGFNYKDGDWPERLYFSQQKTNSALARAKGETK